MAKLTERGTTLVLFCSAWLTWGSLLTVRDVAAFLRVSTRTVHALCDEGKLAHVRIANAIRVEAAALAALVRSRTE